MKIRIIIFQAVLLLQLCYDSISQYMAPGGMMGMQPMMQPMSQAMPMPMPMPGMPMPMPGMAMAQSKIPVVVMPYYSKQQDKIDKAKKKKEKKEKNRKRKRIVKKKKHKSSGSSEASDSKSSGSDSSDEKYYRTKSKRKSTGKKKRDSLTPVVSYVTKNGRVVYQTKIKNENVKDWLVRDKKRRDDEIDDNLS